MSDVWTELATQWGPFLTGVGANITSDALGRIPALLKRPREVEAPASINALNQSLQAALQGQGVSDQSATAVAKFILQESDISYLLSICYAATDDGGLGRRSYGADFEKELAAYLQLGISTVLLQEDPSSAASKIDAFSAELPTIADSLRDLLRATLQNQLTGERRRRLPTGPTRPPATMLFAAAEQRLQRLREMPPPNWTDYLAFGHLYLTSVAENIAQFQQQHLGTTAVATAVEDIYVTPSLSTDQPTLDNRNGGHRVTDVRGAIVASPRTVVLGPAGIGKSSFVRHAMSIVAEENQPEAAIPFLVELRKVGADTPDIIVQRLEQSVAEDAQIAAPHGWVEYMLLTGRAVVFFDGLDEVLDISDRSVVRDRIAAFSRLYPSARLVITSRYTGYDLAPFPTDSFLHLEVQEFDEPRVETYATRWFALVGEKTARRIAGRDHAFLDVSSRLAPDLRRNPLMLSLLCSLYWEDGDIPSSLAELYESCARLMFQTWNTMRGIEDHRVYSRSLRPALFLIAHLIWNNKVWRAQGVPRRELERVLRRHLQRTPGYSDDEAGERAGDLLDLWAGRAWVLTAVSSNQENVPRYGFVHQSFLEYFAAMYEARASDNGRDLFGRVRRAVIYQNGSLMAQTAMSIHDYNREGGGNDFVRSVCADAEASNPAERLALAAFATSCSDLLPLEEGTLLRVIDLNLAVIIDSIPEMGENGSILELEVAVRDASADYQRGLSALADYEAGETELLLGEADARDARPSDLGATLPKDGGSVADERTNLLNGTRPAMLDVEDQVAALARMLRRTTGDSTVLRARLRHHLLEGRCSPRLFIAAVWLDGYQALGRTDCDDGAAEWLRELYSRVPATPDSWHAHVVARSRGIVEFADIMRLVPWNVYLRSGPVLPLDHLIFDWDAPLSGEFLQDFLAGHARFASTIQALGLSVARALADPTTSWTALDRFEIRDHFRLRGDRLSLPEAQPEVNSAVEAVGLAVVFAVHLEAFNDAWNLDLSSLEAATLIVELYDALTAGGRARREPLSEVAQLRLPGPLREFVNLWRAGVIVLSS